MMRRVTDERGIRHERSHSIRSLNESRKGRVPQFTLKGLLWFSAGIAVCLSVAMTGRKCYPAPVGGPLLLLSMALMWLVLWETYRRLHLHAAFLVHWLVPAGTIGVAIVLAAVFDPLRFLGIGPARIELLLGLFAFGGVGCLVGCALSIPVGVLTIVVFVWKAGRARSGGSR